MTATEELRRMLDERGVEHYDGTEMTLWLKDGVGYRAGADEGLNGFIHLHLWCTTPAQAVEATLGRGECRIERDNSWSSDYEWHCTKCGEHVSTCNKPPRFCPRLRREGSAAMSEFDDSVRRVIAEQHDEIAALRRENAELRERVKGFLGQRDERLAAAETRCNELMDLVRDLMRCPVDLYHCETCEHAEVTPKSVTGNWDRYDCKLKARAQELGAI